MLRAIKEYFVPSQNIDVKEEDKPLTLSGISSAQLDKFNEESGVKFVRDFAIDDLYAWTKMVSEWRQATRKQYLEITLPEKCDPICYKYIDRDNFERLIEAIKAESMFNSSPAIQLYLKAYDYFKVNNETLSGHCQNFVLKLECGTVFHMFRIQPYYRGLRICWLFECCIMGLYKNSFNDLVLEWKNVTIEKFKPQSI
jgi:hypothetical protein